MDCTMLWWVLITPEQLGPSTRQPCFRMTASMRAWASFPSFPLSANPAASTTTNRTPFVQQSSMAASAVGKPTCRNVEEISIASEEILGEPHRVVTVRGNAFLHSMVRTIVGTLVMVGRGQRDPDWVAEVLAARDRQAAGENAPARGLIFWSVGY